MGSTFSYYFTKNIKVMLIGSLSSGKSQLLNTYINKTYDKHVLHTTSYIEVHRKKIYDRDVDFYDTSGDLSHFPAILENLKDMNIIIFCHPINKSLTTYNISVWNKVFNYTKCFKILCITMSDLKLKRKCSIEDIRSFATLHNFSGIFKTSALLDYNIKYLFKTAVAVFIAKHLNERLYFKDVIDKKDCYYNFKVIHDEEDYEVKFPLYLECLKNILTIKSYIGKDVDRRLTIRYENIDYKYICKLSNKKCYDFSIFIYKTIDNIMKDIIIDEDTVRGYKVFAEIPEIELYKLFHLLSNDYSIKTKIIYNTLDYMIVKFI